MERVCKKCGEKKQIEEFVKNQKCKHGYTFQCLSCKGEKQSEFRRNNREYTNEQAASYRVVGIKHIERIGLKKKGLKRCSKCGEVNSVDFFLQSGSICSKCRNLNNGNDGRFKKILSYEESKKRRLENTCKWRRNNSLKVRETDKKSRQRPEYKKKTNERNRIKFAKLYPKGEYYTESMLKYKNSEKGKAAKKKARLNWERNNPDKKKEIGKRQIENLKNCYILNKLKRSGFTTDQIRENPEIIEIKRILIKTKRLCKTLQNSETV